MEFLGQAESQSVNHGESLKERLHQRQGQDKLDLKRFKVILFQAKVREDGTLRYPKLGPHCEAQKGGVATAGKLFRKR